MTLSPETGTIPPDWTPLDDTVYERARTATLAALLSIPTNGVVERSVPRDAVARLSDYYDLDGDYAGPTFVDLDRGDQDAISAADLVAIGLLAVTISPRATRRFLQPGQDRDRVRAALESVHDRQLELATADDLAAMDDLHTVVAEIIGKDPWVTTAKLCARKRPELIPVRDRLVRAYLGLEPLRSRRIEWQVYRQLAGDRAVIDALDDVCLQVREGARAAKRRVVLDRHRLRLLDVALWTYASEAARLVRTRRGVTSGP